MRLLGGLEILEGAARFARFAYPPNSLGYCGPEQSEALLRAGVEQGAAEDIRQLAPRFEGAWPYLQLIAAANGIEDPLDAGVVEAYWIGNRLLDVVDPWLFRRFLAEHFGFEDGPAGEQEPLGRCSGPAARPHHNFHVFAVYPWVGLLKAGRSTEPLHVLEKCRIRWGQVLETGPDEALVRGRPLSWDGHDLRLGDARLERVAFRHGGRAMIEPPEQGEWVALHWDWICDVLSSDQVVELSAHTARQLDVVNAKTSSAIR